MTTLLFLVFISSLSLNPIQCSKYHIVGGRDAYPSEKYPFFVNIRQTDFDFFDSPFCGGTLIMPEENNSARFMLTAAHCVCNGSANVIHPYYNQFMVYGNNYFLQAWAEPGHLLSRLVNPPICHKDFAMITNQSYRWTKYINDVAIVELRNPLPLVPNILKPIKMDTGHMKTDDVFDYPFPPYHKLTLVGYGFHLKKDGRWLHPALLQVWDAFLLDDFMCQTSYGNMYDSHSMLCYVNQQSTTCKGDSGDPVFYKSNGINLLVGVHSNGHPDCEVGFPVISMRISYYKPWIEATVEQIINRGK